METARGHKNVALIPWRNKKDKKVQNKVQHKGICLDSGHNQGLC